MKAKKVGRPNWKNRTIWTEDNIKILRRMNSECVDLIYLDPPFNSNANYAAPIGSAAEGVDFSDIFTLDDVKAHWIDEMRAKNLKVFKTIQAAHTDSNKAYLAYMSPRLIEMHRILKETGAIFLHCDPTASHYLKVVMDAIFGPGRLLNEIVWHYQSGTKPKSAFGRKHDLIFWYSKSKNWTYNRQGQPVQNPDRYKEMDEDGRRFLWGGNWDKKKKRGTKKYYLDEGRACDDVWSWIDEPEFNSLNSQSSERTGYPTQKPLKLLERIIKAATNLGDIVLDPFCGCATTLVQADRLGREWVGIDKCEKAADLVVKRIKDDQGMFEDVIHRRDLPNRTDQAKTPPYNCKENKEILYGKQGGDCKGCGVHFLKRNFTVDHIIPSSEGGGDEIDNLQLLCGACNSTKGNRGMEYLIKVLEMEQGWKRRKGGAMQ